MEITFYNLPPTSLMGSSYSSSILTVIRWSRDKHSPVYNFFSLGYFFKITFSGAWRNSPIGKVLTHHTRIAPCTDSEVGRNWWVPRQSMKLYVQWETPISRNKEGCDTGRQSESTSGLHIHTQSRHIYTVVHTYTCIYNTLHTYTHAHGIKRTWCFKVSSIF